MPNDEPQKEPTKFSKRHQFLIPFEWEFKKKREKEKKKRNLTAGNSFSLALNKGNKYSGTQWKKQSDFQGR